VTTYPEAEVRAAFNEYLRRGVGAHDWPGWADLFTDDAVYIEHNLGTFEGRATIKEFIVACMADYPAMTLEVEWAAFDGNRIAFYIWNILPDPEGLGREFQFPNTTVLEYAGDGRFSYEEDFYNPADAARVFGEWLQAGGRKRTPPDRTLHRVKQWNPEPPSPPFPREEVEAEFWKYFERGKLARATGDWAQWADQFTPDAFYREHHYGVFQGRDAIKAWITDVMGPFPEMSFPIEWVMFDGNRVVFSCPNTLADPKGEGSGGEPESAGVSDYAFRVFCVLHYAGNGQWSLEEDIYHPGEAEQVIGAWVSAGGVLPAPS
jgi:predicted SnoaL-like aldol condensation-catalyzing enzyme